MRRPLTTLTLIIGLTLTRSLLAGATPKDLLTHGPGVMRHDALDQLYGDFSTAYAELDASRVAELYAEDALYLSPGSPITAGRRAIRDGFTRMFERTEKQQQTLVIRFDIVAREIDENLAYDVGVYTLERHRDAAVVATSRGKFAVVARRAADGAWSFVVDSYSDIKDGDDRPASPQSRPAATD